MHKDLDSLAVHGAGFGLLWFGAAAVAPIQAGRPARSAGGPTEDALVGTLPDFLRTKA